MKYQTFFTCFLSLIVFPKLVESVTISTTPVSKPVVGQNLTIECSESVSGVNNYIIKLGVEKETSPGVWEDVFQYTYNPGAGGYVVSWLTGAGNWQSRATVVTTLTTDNTLSGSVTLTLPTIRCDDSAVIRCKTSQVGNDLLSQTKNMSVSGVTPFLTLAGGIGCSDFSADKTTCDQCLHSEDPNIVPLYARMNEELTLTCTGDLALPTSANIFEWFKKIRSNVLQESLNFNITNDIPTSYPPGACTVRGTSTLRYYPTSEDVDLQIFCEVATNQMNSRVSTNVSVCVQGTTMAITTRPPGQAETQSGGLGGGPIAGIVIGVIVVIVLVVVLVYFLWYRRRDSGESYSTREADGRSAPPVAKKPEMHDNTNYDSSGDTQRNNHNPQTRPEREPLHYAELDLVRSRKPLDSDNEPTIDRVRRTGQATPYAEIQLPL